MCWWLYLSINLFTAGVGTNPTKQKLWKAAGQGADNRAISATVALDQTSEHGEHGFQGLAGTWVTVLLQKCRVFQQRSTGEHFLSLGCMTQAAIGWKLKVVADGVYMVATPGMTVAECQERICFLTTYRLGPKGTEHEEDFIGIPTTACWEPSCP
jgi:hypothetical protein